MAAITEVTVNAILRDVTADDAEIPLKMTVAVSSWGITCCFEGYGDLSTEPGFGEPVLIENRGGVPHVVVWGDINQEDPTDVLSLAGAAEELRKDEADA